MSQRVDSKRTVVDSNSTPEEADYKHGPSAPQPHDEAKQERGCIIRFVEDYKLAVLREISDSFSIGLPILRVEDPAKVRVPEAEETGRVNIFRGV